MAKGGATRPLPWYQGPKLNPFVFPEGIVGPRIRFLGLVRGSAHSETHRVDIDGQEYDLTVFKFYRWSDLVDSTYFEQCPDQTIKDVMAQSDPFHCECRAYGRLKETNSEHLAIKCYSYIILTDDEEFQLLKASSLDWARPIGQKSQGIRAVAKECLPYNADLEYQMLPRMRNDMLDMHKIGICIYNLSKDSYLQGKVADFSEAMVVPHRDLDLSRNCLAAKRNCERDFINMDAIVDEWNSRHPKDMYNVFFTPAPHQEGRNMQWLANRLFSGSSKHATAAEYDWKQAANSRRALSIALQRDGDGSRKRPRGS